MSKITIIHGAFLPVPALLGGAVEKFWFTLGSIFADKGHHVIHISRRYPSLPATEVINGASHIRISGFASPRFLFVRLLLDLLYSFSVLPRIPPSDFVITSTFWLPFLLRIFPRGKAHIVVDVQRMPKRQYFLYPRTATFRCVSTSVADLLVHQHPLFRHQVVIIPNSLPFLPDLQSPLSVSRVPTILYTGRIHPEKGLELLLHAFALASSNGLHGWSLRIIGPSTIAQGGAGISYLNSLITLAQSLAITASFPGPIYDQSKLHFEYQQASIFVYPSLAENGETFGISPLEAMSFGCVPIVSSLACFSDFIKPDVNGYIFDHRSPNVIQDLSDLLIRLCTSPALLAEMSSRTVHVNSTHHPFSIADMFLNHFKQVKEI